MGMQDEDYLFLKKWSIEQHTVWKMVVFTRYIRDDPLILTSKIIIFATLFEILLVFGECFGYQFNILTCMYDFDRKLVQVSLSLYRYWNTLMD